MTYQPEWDIEASFGAAGERTVRSALGLCRAAIEVKHKRTVDPWFYVELECDFGGRGEYRPSGLSLTKADYWVVVIAETGVMLFFPTRAIRAAVRAPTARDKKCDRDKRYPTRGKLVRLDAVIAAAERTRPQSILTGPPSVEDIPW